VFIQKEPKITEKESKTPKNPEKLGFFGVFGRVCSKKP